MIFQFGSGAVGGQLQQVLRVLEQWGFVDAFLPFVLLFVLLFALLNRLGIFTKGKGNDKTDRRLSGLIAFAISLMIVIPHVLGRYPSNMDPIILINNLLPSAAVMLVAILMLLFLLGLTGKDLPSNLSAIVGLVGAALLALIIAMTIWPSFAYGTFLADPTLQALLIILLVMGLIVWFVTRDTEEVEYDEGLLSWLLKGAGEKRARRSGGTPP